jgi:undecaprenyl diphosphate synthase
LLWQSAYAEFVFTDICWPEFTPKDLEHAIEQYSKRERRFGGVSKAIEIQANEAWSLSLNNT